MIAINKEKFTPNGNYKSDKRYLLTFLEKIGVAEDEENIYLPNEIGNPIEDANLSDDIYNFFQLVFATEEKEISVEDIVGSHDERNIELKTWFQNFFIKDVGPQVLEKYLQNPKAIFQGREKMLLAFEKEGKYYIADGHHRFSTLYIHYYILKSQGKTTNTLGATIKSYVRVVPKNIEFIKRFNAFCIANQLYEEDEIGIMPLFQIADSTPEHPIIRYKDTEILIDEHTDLEQILPLIQSSKRKKV